MLSSLGIYQPSISVRFWRSEADLWTSVKNLMEKNASGGHQAIITDLWKSTKDLLGIWNVLVE